MSKPSVPPVYAFLLKEIKDRIAKAQARAVLSEPVKEIEFRDPSWTID